jgi:hypothetical protein
VTGEEKTGMKDEEAVKGLEDRLVTGDRKGQDPGLSKNEPADGRP